MSWKTIAIIMIVVFAVVGFQSMLADPLTRTASQFNASGDYSNDAYDGNSLIMSMPQTFLDMGLIMMFGLMAYGVAVVVKREITQGRL